MIMKKHYLLGIIIFFGALKSLAQIPMDKCGTMPYLEQQIKANPLLQKRMEAYDEKIKQYLKSMNPNAAAGGIITIPVVVHVIYNVDSQNISDKRIIDQIAITNRDFAGLNYHSMGLFPASLKANVGIQFCLAQKKPDGTATSGIERKKNNIVSYASGADSAKFSVYGGLDAWDPERYLNVWVCNYLKYDTLGYRFSAYAQYPGGGLDETYGVLIRYGAMGPTDSTYYRGNGGVLTHEFGHCFNLHHIWGDDDVSCSGSDLVGDTPDQGGRTTGVHTGLLTDNCTATSPGIMYMNFMDYSDDIVFANFTPLQAERMLTNFEMQFGILYILSQSDACSKPSTGVEVIEMPGQFRVFPNPAKEKVTLRYFLSREHFIEVHVLDLSGRLLMMEKFLSQNGMNENDIDLNRIAGGIYFIEVIVEGEKSMIRKFVVE
jgi:hypothetical protein